MAPDRLNRVEIALSNQTLNLPCRPDQLASGIDDLPDGVFAIRNALYDDLHDAKQRERE